MTDAVRIIAANLEQLRGRIADAAARSGRSETDITLVAITKYVDAPLVRALISAGANVFGESRPQQLWAKAAELQGADLQGAELQGADLQVQDVEWHLVGHLQRNKIRQTLPHVAMIQSADSQRLVAAIDRESERLGRTTPVLLEVNISGDEAKHGFAPDEVATALPNLANCQNVAIRGLMAMAHRVGDAEIARRDFAAMRELRDHLASELPDNVSLDELSLGMSADFEQAVLEGATMVRIGRALFKGLDLPQS